MPMKPEDVLMACVADIFPNSAAAASPAAASGDASAAASKIKIKVLKPPSFIKFKTDVMEVSNAAAATQKKSAPPALHLNLLRQIQLTDEQKVQLKEIYN